MSKDFGIFVLLADIEHLPRIELEFIAILSDIRIWLFFKNTDYIYSLFVEKALNVWSPSFLKFLSDHFITSEMLHCGINIAAGSIALGRWIETEHYIIKLELQGEF